MVGERDGGILEPVSLGAWRSVAYERLDAIDPEWAKKAISLQPEALSEFISVLHPILVELCAIELYPSRSSLTVVVRDVWVRLLSGFGTSAGSPFFASWVLYVVKYVCADRKSPMGQAVGTGTTTEALDQHWPSQDVSAWLSHQDPADREVFVQVFGLGKSWNAVARLMNELFPASGLWSTERCEARYFALLASVRTASLK